jgi:cytidylate kinase
VIIAVDGPAAAGKGTIARRLAEHFNLAYLDTGLLYRAVGIKARDRGIDPADPGAAAVARELSADDLDDPRLRGDEAAGAASLVAAQGKVRDALKEFQHDFARHPPDTQGGPAAGAVLDGRDIGTQVCPDADIKLFITAAVEVRAERRLKELRDRGLEAIYGRVLRDMSERDKRDRERDVAPLKPADDAFVLDTSDLDAEAAFNAALEFIQSRNV